MLIRSDKQEMLSCSFVKHTCSWGWEINPERFRDFTLVKFLGFLWTEACQDFYSKIKAKWSIHKHLIFSSFEWRTTGPLDKWIRISQQALESSPWFFLIPALSTTPGFFFNQKIDWFVGTLPSSSCKSLRVVTMHCLAGSYFASKDF